MSLPVGDIMRYLLLLAALGVAVSACQSEQPATGATAAKLGATCAGYGFKPGTDSYSACVFQLDQNRIAENYNRRMRVAAALSAAGAASQPPRPVTCTRTTWGSVTCM